MSPIRVIVYDDEFEIAGNLASQIKAVCGESQVTPADKDDFQQLMDLIHSRRTALREGDLDSQVSDSQSADQADVIVVDYDLLGYSETSDTTGSRLAYLMRCFLKCGFIIILNRDRIPNPFYLTLGSPTDDFADLHVSSGQIGHPGLWQAPFDGFRPWYWPLIPYANNDLEQCVRDVQENLDAPILSFFELDRVIDWLPRPVRDFLERGQKSKRCEDVTFRDFAEYSSGVDRKDGLTPDQFARVSAARIVTLLNLIILPEQSVLVDAPHLVSRFPSLIQGGGADIEVWNSLCNPVSQEVSGLLDEGLRQYEFRRSHWLWRPAWYWPEISRDESIVEVNDPWAAEEVSWVFCEDISRFVPIDAAREFRAVVSPPFIRRFILDNDSPSTQRYVRHVGKGGPLDPCQIDYVPLSALSM